MRLAVLTLILSAVIGLGEARAQVLPAPVFLQIPAIVQMTPTWDWAAVAQQIIAVRVAPNPPPNQCALIEYSYDKTAGSCCGIYDVNSCSVRGSMQQVAGLIAKSGANVLPFSLPTTPTDIHSALMMGRPIILLLKDVPEPDSYHYVLIRGIHFEALNGNAAAILHVNDPWTGYVRTIPFQNVFPSAVAAISVGK